jgi:hypothetical protein
MFYDLQAIAKAKVNTIKYYVYTENRAVWFLGLGMQKYIRQLILYNATIYEKALTESIHKGWFSVYRRVVLDVSKFNFNSIYSNRCLR